jgi:hypothetical protein
VTHLIFLYTIFFKFQEYFSLLADVLFTVVGTCFQAKFSFELRLAFSPSCMAYGDDYTVVLQVYSSCHA